MTIALVFPPTCDPTAPYLAVPMLTGFLRREGLAVIPIDANVEAWDELLAPSPLTALRDRIEARIAGLEARTRLDHEAQLEYATLYGSLAEAHAVPRGIAEAKAVLRDEPRFWDCDSYADAVATVDAAMRVISAAYHPLHVDFTAYRTPFGLLSPEDARAESTREHNPFFDYVASTLAPRLVGAGVSVIGVSIAFPGQLQPAYSFAYQLRARFPNVHLTCGGPGMTQILVRLRGAALARALGPFDSAVVFEGEHTLLALVQALVSGRDLREISNLVVRDDQAGAAWTEAPAMEDLARLPAPDFDGLPLDRYFAPHLVLPYDPTRGCYWGRCAFCHYGLARAGTAQYRERPIADIVDHLRGLRTRYGTHRFYFSQDSVAPRTAVALSKALVEAELDLRWATDLKPEKTLTRDHAQALAASGAIACALGVESGNDRILSLIDKGPPIAVVSDVIDNLADAGIAAEAMCFTGFPTETCREALETIEFLDQKKDRLGVFILGEFGITHGSRVARSPEAFGLSKIWQLEGDEMGLGLFYEESAPPQSDEDRATIEEALRAVSSEWLLRPYPWAGAVSTAHTLLYYDHFGPGIFRQMARRHRGRVIGARVLVREARFDLFRAGQAADREAAIWWHMVNEARAVSRQLYEQLATRHRGIRPSSRRIKLEAGLLPREQTPGRRPKAQIRMRRER